MLVFIDESGDTGLKTNNGSSKLFVIALVVFDEIEEALNCDKQIEKIRKKIGNRTNFEIKFNKLKKEQRVKFFKTIFPCQFFYFGIVINKEKLYGQGFKVKESFYKYTSSLVFQNARAYLSDAIVVVDGSGSREFKQQFKLYLRKKLGSGVIKKFKIQNSSSNNLIQLADMIAGAIHRSYQEKKDSKIYRGLIGAKEMSVQMWPK